MKKNKYIIAFLLLFSTLNGKAQLNQFFIGWQFYDLHVGTFCPVLEWMPEDYQNYFTKMKGYGFNTVQLVRHYNYENCRVSTSPITKILLDATNSNLNIVLRCYELCSEKPEYNFNVDDASNALKYYKSSNLIGYDIADEPQPNENTTCPNKLLKLPPFLNSIKDSNAELLRDVNLLPKFCFGLDDKKYRENYIQEFINKSSPNLLSFDDYPIKDFYDSTKRNHFFDGLYDIAIKSVENSIPIIYITTPFRDDINDTLLSVKTSAEFKYEIYAALSYGAKGINYWPGFDWVVYRDSNKTHIAEQPYKLNINSLLLNELTQLHNKLTSTSNSAELLSLNFASAYHKSFTSTIGSTTPEKIHDFCSWNNIANDKYAQQVFENPSMPYDIVTGYDPPNNYYDPLVISFLTNNQGKIYFWLFNKSLMNPLNFYMLGKANAVGFRDVLNNITYQTITPYIELSPGEAKLFTSVSSTFNPINYSINNNIMYDGVNSISGQDHFYAFESANQITFGIQNATTTNVTFQSNATKSFMAKNIIINPGVRIESGSTVRFRAYTDSNNQNGNGQSFAPKRKQAHNPEEKPLIESKIYPNPTRDNFIINTNLSENEKVDMTIYDNMGRAIKVVKAVSQETNISLQNQPAGIYLVRFTRNDKTYNYKVVKL